MRDWFPSACVWSKGGKNGVLAILLRTPTCQAWLLSLLLALPLSFLSPFSLSSQSLAMHPRVLTSTLVTSICWPCFKISLWAISLCICLSPPRPSSPSLSLSFFLSSFSLFSLSFVFPWAITVRAHAVGQPYRDRNLSPPVSLLSLSRLLSLLLQHNPFLVSLRLKYRGGESEDVSTVARLAQTCRRNGPWAQKCNQ